MTVGDDDAVVARLVVGWALCHTAPCRPAVGAVEHAPIEARAQARLGRTDHHAGKAAGAS